MHSSADPVGQRTPRIGPGSIRHGCQVSMEKPHPMLQDSAFCACYKAKRGGCHMHTASVLLLRFSRAAVARSVDYAHREAFSAQQNLLDDHTAI